MNRRSFLSSLAAAMATPVLAHTAIADTTQTIDWKLFTAADNSIRSRFDLTTPWTSGGKAYASDAMVMISCDGSGVETGPSSKRPDIAACDWYRFDEAGWQPSQFIRRAVKSDILMCPNCVRDHLHFEHRMAVTPIDFSKTSVWDELDEEFYDPARVFPGCSHCKEGYMDGGYVLQFGDSIFDPALIKRFELTGEFEIKPEEHCLLVRGDGWRGAVMSLIPENFKDFRL